MCAINDAFYRSKIRQRWQLVQATQAALLRLDRLYEQATWRLNEAEAAAPACQHAFGYGPLTFTYPYGQRRPNQIGYMSQEDYLASLPAEHQGNPHHVVHTPLGGWDYPVSDYLRRTAQREALYKLYRLNWLGRWVRK